MQGIEGSFMPKKYLLIVALVDNWKVHLPVLGFQAGLARYNSDMLLQVYAAITQDETDPLLYMILDLLIWLP